MAAPLTRLDRSACMRFSAPAVRSAQSHIRERGLPVSDNDTATDLSFTQLRIPFRQEGWVIAMDDAALRGPMLGATAGLAAGRAIRLTPTSPIPAVGGAMDLAIGAKSVYVLMELLTRDGKSKLVDRCTYPLTGVACVSRLYTDVAVFDLQDGRILLREDLAGAGIAELQRLIGMDLVAAPA